jgi:hypothetical protein
MQGYDCSNYRHRVASNSISANRGQLTNLCYHFSDYFHIRLNRTRLSNEINPLVSKLTKNSVTHNTVNLTFCSLHLNVGLEKKLKFYPVSTHSQYGIRLTEPP